MRGIGGPLLSIGDLLSDVGEEKIPPIESTSPTSLSPSSAFSHDSTSTLQTPDLPKLFQAVILLIKMFEGHHYEGIGELMSNAELSLQESYDQLIEALARGDHSWTALTLKLCSSLEMANALVQSTNSNTRLLLDRIGELEKIIRRGDSAVAAAKAIQSIYSSAQDSSSSGSQNIK